MINYVTFCIMSGQVHVHYWRKKCWLRQFNGLGNDLTGNVSSGFPMHVTFTHTIYLNIAAN